MTKEKESALKNTLDQMESLDRQLKLKEQVILEMEERRAQDYAQMTARLEMEKVEQKRKEQQWLREEQRRREMEQEEARERTEEREAQLKKTQDEQVERLRLEMD